MTTRIINDAASMARQRLLLAAFDTWAMEHEAAARTHLAANAIEDANAAIRRAINLRGSMGAIHAALMEAAGLSLDDAEQLAAIQITDEPPTPLVDLTAWLRGKVGHWFPFVPSTAWQAIAFVLAAHRRQP